MWPKSVAPNVVLELLIEVNLDMNLILRENFEILDLLGDVGGMQAILISFFQFVLFFFNYHHFDSFMASKLFKIKKVDDEEEKSKTYFERSTFFKPLNGRNLRNYMMDTLPKRLKCCKATRQDRAIKKAITEMDKEIDIIEMIKSRRFFKMALRKLLSDKERMDLKDRSRYIMIDPDSGEDAKLAEKL